MADLRRTVPYMSQLTAELEPLITDRHRYAERYVMPTDLAPFLPEAPDNDALQVQVAALLAQQYAVCEPMRKSIDALARLETRWESTGNVRYLVQFNPARERNTKDLSKQAAAKRPCFLDPEHMLPGEKGIPYGDLLICGNPFPILKDHLTIIQQEHVDQSFQLLLRPALELAAALKGSHFLFYNGPSVGASAPDHAHLQGGAREQLIIEGIVANTPAETIYSSTTGRVRIPHGLPQALAVVTSSRLDESEHLTDAIMGRLPVPPNYTEPPANVVFTHANGTWTTYVIPRSRFRPSCFAADAPKQLLISPAALEMTNLIVTARRADFDAITSADIAHILSEVSLPVEVLQNMLSDLR